jgi:hypothetical protein
MFPDELNYPEGSSGLGGAQPDRPSGRHVPGNSCLAGRVIRPGRIPAGQTIRMMYPDIPAECPGQLYLLMEARYSHSE